MSFFERARSSLVGSSSIPRVNSRETPATTPNANSQPATRKPRSKPPVEPKPLSQNSSPHVLNSLWYARDIQLAASVVIIQPSTSLFVVISEKMKYKHPNGQEREFEHWFLPRGRKDVGESLEETAVREGYEEVTCFVISCRCCIPHLLLEWLPLHIDAARYTHSSHTSFRSWEKAYSPEIPQ